MKLEDVTRSDRLSLIAEEKLARISKPESRFLRRYRAFVALRDAVRAHVARIRER